MLAARLNKLVAALLIPALILLAAPRQVHAGIFDQFKPKTTKVGTNVDLAAGGIAAGVGGFYAISVGSQVVSAWTMGTGAQFLVYMSAPVLAPVFIVAAVAAVAGTFLVVKAIRSKRAANALASSTSTVAERAKAAAYLGKTDKDYNLSTLKSALKDGAPEVRFAAVNAIQALGKDTVKAALPELDALIAGETDANVKAAATAIVTQHRGFPAPAPVPTSGSSTGSR